MKTKLLYLYWYLFGAEVNGLGEMEDRFKDVVRFFFPPQKSKSQPRTTLFFI